MNKNPILIELIKTMYLSYLNIKPKKEDIEMVVSFDDETVEKN